MSAFSSNNDPAAASQPIAAEQSFTPSKPMGEPAAPKTPRSRLTLGTLTMVLGAGLAVFWVSWQFGTSSLAPKAPPVLRFEELAWKTHDFPRAKVKLSLPGNPVAEDLSQHQGALLVVCSDIDKAALKFCLHVFPQKLDQSAQTPSLHDVRQMVLADYPGSMLLSSRTVDWKPGKAMEIRLKTSDGDETLHRRLFARDRIIILSVRGVNLAPYEQAIGHFVNSLQIDDEPAENRPNRGEKLGDPRKAE